MANTVLWTFENPVNLTATYSTQVTWTPHTFGSASSSNNFSINLWLLHHDNSADAVQHDYVDILLAENQNVFNNTVWWTPSIDEVDVGVAQPGSHQLSWEFYDNNTDVNALAVDLRGFSKGFNIFYPAGYISSSTTSTSATSATSSIQTGVSTTVNSALTSTTSGVSLAPLTDTSSSNTTSKSKNSLAIGLGIGLGLLGLLSVAAAIFLLKQKRRKGARMIAGFGARPVRGLDLAQKPSISKDQTRNSNTEFSSEPRELPGDFYHKIPTNESRYEMH